MGLDRLGVGPHQTQFGAHAFDVAVDAALVTGVGGNAQRVEQLLAAEYALGLFQQALQVGLLQQGFGLAGMRERVKALGGTLNLSCTHGTRVSVSLPLRSYHV